MAETVLGNVIEFFQHIGIYDVVLPFLLVFTIMFAILEKTKVLGTEGKEHYTRKNLNAMASFVVAFLVIASSKLVETITQVSSQIVVLLLLVVFFLMLISTMYTEKEIQEGGMAEKGWKMFFVAFMFIGTLGIFLDAIKTESGKTWLEVFTDWLSQFYTSTAVASIILIIFIVLFVWWIIKSPKEVTTPPAGGSSP
jgi:hypothetical protein